MKKLMLFLLLMLFPVVVDAQVMPQYNQAVNGQPLIRFVNNGQFWVSCFYRDQYTYYTFTLGPRQASYWYPIYGSYQWQCR